MTRQEFIEKLSEIDVELGPLADQQLTNEDYLNIELVYTYHPVIRNSVGKKQIAMIYAYGGMGVIRDMMTTAERARRIEIEVSTLKAKQQRLEAELEALRTGKQIEEVIKE